MRWLDRLPGLARSLLAEWELTPDGASLHGYASLVLPVRSAEGEPAMLKLTYDGDEESRYEHLVLRHWHGRGAVRLLRADPHRRALLLERLHPQDLSGHGDLEACEIVAGLYASLHRPALPQLQRLASYVERWAAPLAHLPRDTPIPRRLVEQVRALVPDLLADDGDARILHGDLHYFNVLAGDREPWLAIDPKPMAGDPHYEPAPMLWNRWEELVHDIRSGLRRRFYALVDAGARDEERARDWVIVRMVLNAHWAIEDAGRQRRALSAEEREWITRCVTIAKAVQE